MIKTFSADNLSVKNFNHKSLSHVGPGDLESGLKNTSIQYNFKSFFKNFEVRVQSDLALYNNKGYLKDHGRACQHCDNYINKVKPVLGGLPPPRNFYFDIQNITN